MKRRDFLGVMIALPATSHSFLASVEERYRRPVLQLSTTHLDLITAQAIKERFQENPPNESDVLDLSLFRSASMEAIELLASLEFGFADIGFTELSAEVAKALSAWNSYLLIFNRLSLLSPRAAKALGTDDAEHALVFSQLKLLDALSAQHLVKATGLGCPLSLRLSGQLTPRVARALAEHRHELSIDLDTPLLPNTAGELASHNGYNLEIHSQTEITSEVIQRLRANPAKSLSICSPAEMDTIFPNYARGKWTATLIAPI